jgi:hypothetical protein
MKAWQLERLGGELRFAKRTEVIELLPPNRNGNMNTKLDAVVGGFWMWVALIRSSLRKC